MRKSGKQSPGSKISKKPFTKRELQIIRFICRQYSNQEMATEMGLSIRTVEGFRDCVFKKTKSKNAVGVVLFAIRHGMFKV